MAPIFSPKHPIKSFHAASSKPLSANLCPLQDLSKHSKYLIIDEKSMTCIKFLGFLDQYRREIFPVRKYDMHSGINIYTCGDFHKSPLIGRMMMYSNLSNT